MFLSSVEVNVSLALVCINDNVLYDYTTLSYYSFVAECEWYLYLTASTMIVNEHLHPNEHCSYLVSNQQTNNWPSHILAEYPNYVIIHTVHVRGQ